MTLASFQPSILGLQSFSRRSTFALSMKYAEVKVQDLLGLAVRMQLISKKAALIPSFKFWFRRERQKENEIEKEKMMRDHTHTHNIYYNQENSEGSSFPPNPHTVTSTVSIYIIFISTREVYEAQNFQLSNWTQIILSSEMLHFIHLCRLHMYPFSKVIFTVLFTFML